MTVPVRRVSLDINDTGGLPLLDALDDFSNTGAHSDQHVEDPGASRIEADVLYQQPRTRLAGGCHQPECGARNIARNCKIPRLDLLLAEHGDAAFLRFAARIAADFPLGED